MPDIDISEIFIDNLKELLETHNMTNKEFAQKIGVKASSVSMWMNGNSLPRMGTLDKIADLFSVSVDSLVTSKDSDTVSTLAAHFDGEEYTEEQLKRIEEFAKFIKSQDNAKKKGLIQSLLKKIPEYRKDE